MRQSGFTLVEVLLSVAVVTILVGLSLPLYAGFQSRNDLDLTTQTVAETVRRAQSYARAGKGGGSVWGIEVVAGAVVLFKGTSYATRTTLNDETIPLNALSTSGLSDITFASLTGYPSSSGTITLTDAGSNVTRTITLSGNGMVSY